MQNPFLYPGRGINLRQVAASTGNVPADPDMSNVTIEDGEYSETIAAHDCKELMFEFVFGASATGDVVIQEVIDAAASVAGETFSTETMAGERLRKWNAGEPLVGFYRIFNDSGQDMTVYCQKAI